MWCAGSEMTACQPGDLALIPLRFTGAMHELRAAGMVRQLDLELDRLAGEAFVDVALDDRKGFVADHVGDSFADDLLGHETVPLRKVPVDELVPGLRVAVRDRNRGAVGDKAQLAFALAQQTFGGLSFDGGLAKLRH